MRANRKYLALGVALLSAAAITVGCSARSEGGAGGAQAVIEVAPPSDTYATGAVTSEWAEDAFEASRNPQKDSVMVLKKGEDGKFHFYQWRKVANPAEAAKAGTKGTASPRPTPPAVGD